MPNQGRGAYYGFSGDGVDFNVYDKDGNIILQLEGDNRKAVVPSGSTMDGAGTFDFSSGTVTYRAILNADIGAAAAIARSKLAQDDLKPFAIPLTDFRVWNALQTVLPGAAAADDLGLIGGTFGTASPVLEGVANAAGSSETQYGRVQVRLPAEYVDGETITLRFPARMSQVVNTAATLDCEVYLSDKNAGVGSDICATAAQSINSATWADIDFTVTPTGLVAGDVLDIRITAVADDTGGSATGRAQVGPASLLCDVKG